MNKQRYQAIMEMVFEFIYISTDPYKWSNRVRKIFVLTIILSGPLWLTYISLFIAIGLILIIIGNIYDFLKGIWDGEAP